MLFGLSLQQRIPQSLLKYLTQRANQWPFGMSDTFYPQSSLFPRLGTSSNYAGLHTMSLDFVSSWHWQVSRTTRPISPVVVVQSLVSSWHWQVSRTTSPISPVVVVQSLVSSWHWQVSRTTSPISPVVVQLTCQCQLLTNDWTTLTGELDN